jgi:hypothetical protein
MQLCGAYWATNAQWDTFLKSFKRIADQNGPDAQNIVWLSLRRYPALVLLYGMGLAAIANSNYRFLRDLLTLNLRVDSSKPDERTGVTLNNLSVLTHRAQKALPGRENEHTPLSNHLFEVLRDPLRQYLPDDAVYNDTFDWLEFMLSLTHIDLQMTRNKLREEKTRNPDFYRRAPVGRFSWKAFERGVMQATEPTQDGVLPANVVAALQAGFCEAGDGTQTDKYLDIRAALLRFIGRVRQEWNVWV